MGFGKMSIYVSHNSDFPWEDESLEWTVADLPGLRDRLVSGMEIGDSEANNAVDFWGGVVRLADEFEALECDDDHIFFQSPGPEVDRID